MKRRSALAGSFLIATLDGCGLLFDFDYHARSSTSSGSGGGGSTQGSGGGGAQGGSGGGCVDTSNDPHNCGKCGWDCLGGACVEGECQAAVVVQGTSGQDDFNHLAMDSTSLYWTSKGRILSVAKDAPPLSPPALSTPATLEADFIAVDANNVYWSVFHAGMNTAINRAPKADPTAFTAVADMELQPVGVTVGGNLFWSSYNTGGAIRTAATTGAGLMDLVPQQDRVLFMLPVGPDLYWSYRGDATDVHGGVRKLVAGTVTEIAKDEYAPSGIAVDPTAVYWVCHDGKVRKAPKAGGDPPPAAEDLAPYEGMHFYAEIVVDDQLVYWTGLHTVWRVPKDGSGSPQDFGGAVWAAVPALKMDGRVLYWTTGSDARLMRKVKRAPP